MTNFFGQRLAFISFFTPTDNPYDKINDNNEVFHSDDKPGFHRLKYLFHPHEDFVVHPLLISSIQNSLASGIIGGIYGGIVASRYTFINFIENNEATQFLSHKEAKKILSDKMFVGFYKGFVTLGSKILFFSSTFLVTTTIISFYRNKNSSLHYSAGAVVAGALYKVNLGPKGMISGGVFGGIFGLIFGGLKFVLLKLSHLTEEDIRDFQIKLNLKRNEAIKQAYKECQELEAEQELLDLLKNSKR